jgi:hypothetical protein
MKKYRAQFYDIEAIEILRETEKQVVLMNGLRESKTTEWQSWHDSYEDAKKHLIAAAQKDINSINIRLNFAKERLEKINNLKEVAK